MFSTKYKGENTKALPMRSFIFNASKGGNKTCIPNAIETKKVFWKVSNREIKRLKLCAIR